MWTLLQLIGHLNIFAGMNMRQGPFRLHKAHVFLYWTPIETIFYKLCLSACRLRSLSIFLSSSPSTPCLNPVCLLPARCEFKLSHPLVLIFLVFFLHPLSHCDRIFHGCPWLNVGMFVCLWATVCIGLCCLLTWTNCQRRQCARQQHVARPIDPFRGLCRAGIQSCMFEGNWNIG